MPFKMKEQQRHIKGLIAETLTLLCKSGLSFKENCKIEALIGITLDDDDVFLVNIKQRLGDKGNAVSNYTSSELEDNEVADSGGESGGPSKKHKKNRKRKRKRSSSQRTTDGPDSARKQRKADHGETDSMDEFDGDDYGTMENNDSETIGSVLHSSGEPNIACVKTEPEETHEGIVIVKQEQPSPTHERSTDDTYGQLDSVVANQTNDVTASDNDGQFMTDGITGEATQTATKKTSKATKIQPQPLVVTEVFDLDDEDNERPKSAPPVYSLQFFTAPTGNDENQVTTGARDTESNLATDNQQAISMTEHAIKHVDKESTEFQSDIPSNTEGQSYDMQSKKSTNVIDPDVTSTEQMDDSVNKPQSTNSTEIQSTTVVNVETQNNDLQSTELSESTTAGDPVAKPTEHSDNLASSESQSQASGDTQYQPFDPNGVVTDKNAINEADELAALENAIHAINRDTETQSNNQESLNQSKTQDDEREQQNRTEAGETCDFHKAMDIENIHGYQSNEKASTENAEYLKSRGYDSDPELLTAKRRRKISLKPRAEIPRPNIQPSQTSDAIPSGASPGEIHDASSSQNMRIASVSSVSSIQSSQVYQDFNVGRFTPINVTQRVDADGTITIDLVDSPSYDTVVIEPQDAEHDIDEHGNITSVTSNYPMGASKISPLAPFSRSKHHLSSPSKQQKTSGFSEKSKLQKAVNAVKERKISLYGACAMYKLSRSSLRAALAKEKAKGESTPYMYTREEYQEALRAVQNGSMRLYEAAKHYGIPDGTLRNAVKRGHIGEERHSFKRAPSPQGYTKKDYKEAFDKVKSGKMRVSDAARHYKIPETTLSNAVRRGYISQETDHSRSRYTEEQYQAAVNDVESDRLSLNEASRLYGIPLSTIYGAVYRRKNHNPKKSSLSVLTAKKIQLNASRRAEDIKNRTEQESLPFKFLSIKRSYTEKQYLDAINAVRKDGMSVPDASRKFAVPAGTIHSAVKRLENQSGKVEKLPPLPFKFMGKGRGYTEENYRKALFAVRSGKMGVNEAARTFNVPRGTLQSTIGKLRNKGTFALGGKSRTKPIENESVPKDIKPSTSSKTSGDKHSSSLLGKELKVKMQRVERTDAVKSKTLIPKYKCFPRLYDYSDEEVQKALISIRNGARVSDAAKSFGIPFGSLKYAWSQYRSKKLKLSANFTRKFNRSYTPDQYQKALEAVQTGEMELKDAARFYKVPYGTLHSSVERANMSQIEAGAKKVKDGLPSKLAEPKVVLSRESVPDTNTSKGPIPERILLRVLNSIKSTVYTKEDYKSAIENIWYGRETVQSVCLKYNIQVARMQRTMERIEKRTKFFNLKSTVKSSSLGESAFKGKQLSMTRFVASKRKPLANSRYKSAVKAAVRKSHNVGKKYYSIRAYSSQDLHAAVKEVREDRLNCLQAAKIYKVPKTTIWQWAKKATYAEWKQRVASDLGSEHNLDTKGPRSDSALTITGEDHKALSGGIKTIKKEGSVPKIKQNKYALNADIPVKVLEQAIRQVVDQGMKMKKVSKLSFIPMQRLRYHVQLYREMKQELKAKQIGAVSSNSNQAADTKNLTTIENNTADSTNDTSTKGGSYTKADLNEAVLRIVKSHGNMQHVSKQYGIPFDVLKKHVTKMRQDLREEKMVLPSTPGKSKSPKDTGTKSKTKATTVTVRQSPARRKTTSTSSSKSFDQIKPGCSYVIASSDEESSSDGDSGPGVNRMKMNAALRDIESGEMSLRQASESHGVSMADLMEALNDML